jgi:hypothetical protein
MVNTMRKADPNALVAVMTRNVGFVKAMKVLTFVAAWGIATESLGHPPVSVEEYADWWKESYPTAYREQKLFREALPGETTPERIWTQARRHVQAQLDAKSRSKRKQVDLAAATLAGMALNI